MKRTLRNVLIVLAVLFSIPFIFAGCDMLGDDGQADTTLYHLTLTTNLTEKVQQDDLIASYAGGENYDEPRDEYEVEELKKAGADVDKAGVKQPDGSYYFFDQDPIIITAPQVEGYVFLGFFDKSKPNAIYPEYHATYNQGKTNSKSEPIPDYRWNMEGKNITLEARYEILTYDYYFDDVKADETNPNLQGTYCPIIDSDKYLEPATTTNPNKSFKYWEYQDNSGQKIPLIDGKLPTNYQDDSMRINAYFEYKTFKITFAFRVDDEPLDYDDVIVSMIVSGNRTMVDGEFIESRKNQSIDKDSELGIEYDSDIQIFFTLKSQYKIFCFEVNGERNDRINAAHMDPPYINIDTDDITTDTIVVTFVLSHNN